MNGWKYSFNPKVHQRAVNKVLRDMNKNIENDDLWQGRFFMRQWSRETVYYEDHSGLYLWLEIRLYDKKTKKYLRWFCDSHDVLAWNGYKVWEKMNNFIVEDLDVWRNEPDPRDSRFNWRTISSDKTIHEATPLREW